MEVECKLKCVNGKRHYYRSTVDKICYKCHKTKEENGTKVGGRTTFSGRNQTNYEMNKNWRKTHPRLRYKGKEKYYKKHNKYDVLSGKRYSYDDEQIILTKIYKEKSLIDVEIAKLLGRTLKAIQIKRTKLRKE
jgi:hypothetical protein